jgi:hypothetical protein
VTWRKKIPSIGKPMRGFFELSWEKGVNPRSRDYSGGADD